MDRHKPNAPAHAPLPRRQLRDLLWPKLEPTEDELQEIEQEELGVGETGRDDERDTHPTLH